MKKLSELVRGLDFFYLVNFTAEPIVTHLTHDSNLVEPGSLFFALPGTRTNGKMYAMNAIAKGATAVVVEEELGHNIPQIVVRDVRAAMSLISKTFNNNTVDQMRIIGITGTNGKTTTSHIIFHILSKNKVPCALIGTLGVKAYPDIKIDLSSLTTPDPIELHQIFKTLHSNGINTIIMECSAHAISLKKLEGIHFKQGIFTNLSQDHLDFFGDYRTYADTKINWFDERIQTAIINADDEEYSKLKNNMCDKMITYSIENKSDFIASRIKFKPDGTRYKLNGKDSMHSALPGRFNIYNCLAATISCNQLGLHITQITRALKTLPNIPGRFNAMKVKDFSVIIDYAHTPDSLEKVICSVRELVSGKNGKIITVFGCGGNRDILKRQVMGEISARLSDFTVITSDNPRDENPMSIMYQIEAGAKLATENYILIENRHDAIIHALKHASKNDVVIIAGKGAEEYQEIAGKKHLFSDFKVVKEFK
ncbi:MAG: UDP-N-acetylmuramoyl-L-alanyl-D-glutamate--2,6-diaminopimelate ligase [Firmicutes bacterium]|nr:UDP-N-acetylmuramoyl-L-alanyl-D-glutamate--2,6-diaminopimelate ligase [Bacillota bacterium]